MKNKNLIIGIVALVVLGVFVLTSMSSKNNNVQNAVNGSLSPTSVPNMASNSASASGSAVSNGEVTELTVQGSNFKFVPTVLNVKLGDTVKIVFKNTDGRHDFVIDEFGVKTQVIATGASGTVQFVANKKGSFAYYCSVGNHRAMGMAGTLVVS